MNEIYTRILAGCFTFLVTLIGFVWLLLQFPALAAYNIRELFEWVCAGPMHWPPIMRVLLIAIFSFSFISMTLIDQMLFAESGNKKRDLRSKKSALDLTSRGVQPPKGIYAGDYGNKPFYVSFQDRGLVIGPPGTGKTSFLVNQIKNCANNGLSFIAIDIKPEIHDFLENYLGEQNYRILRVDPISGTGDHYNLLDDIEDDTDIAELVANILPLPQKDIEWTRAEQKYLRLALLFLKHHPQLICSLPAAYQMFVQYHSAESFLKTVIKSENEMVVASAKKLLGELDVSKPSRAGYGQIFESMNWLYHDNVRDSLSYSDFSLGDLGKERPIALFVQFEESKLGTMGSLLSVFYGHILNYLIRHTDREPVALFFDEIGNIPVINGLIEKLNTIRSRMLPTWLYWQSVSQMAKYGQFADNAKNDFFSSADLHIFFRCNSTETQMEVSRMIGTTTKMKTTRTKSRTDQGVDFYLSNGTSGESVSEERVNVIEPHEIGELNQFEVITLYRGGKAIGLAKPSNLTE